MKKRKHAWSLSAIAVVLLVAGQTYSEEHCNTLVEKRAKPLEWLFPTGDETPHEGMAFADGVTGVLAWGGGDTLKHLRKYKEVR